MALDTEAKKTRLDRITHGLRASQLIYRSGPGSMVEFPDQTLTVAAPEYWEDQAEKIHDERLERALNVDYFGVPSSETGEQYGIGYVRFPEWYFCPSCRRFKPIGEWVAQYRKTRRASENNPDMVKKPHCPDCWKPLVVSRIVTVCENGHIDDFPWVEWVHARGSNGRGICSDPKLKIFSGNSAFEGLEGASIKCETCGASSNLARAFKRTVFEEMHEAMKGAYDFSCKGKHPWKHKCEKCAAFPRTMQRGSSSLYFPVNVTSLVIPPYSSLMTAKIEESSAYEEASIIFNALRNMPGIQPEVIQKQIEASAQKVAVEIGGDIGMVKEILQRKLLRSDDEDEAVSDFLYRAEEYDALSGRTHTYDEDYDGDFIREDTDIAEYKLPFVKNISLITKVREVIALVGFTRISPQDNELSATRPRGFVPIKEEETRWYPAYQVRGEGIFIEFSEADIAEWLEAHPIIQHRSDLLNDNYRKSAFGAARPRKISGKYLLLHTLSHLLIKQLSFDCGYGIASLKERVYCGEATDGKQMAGIFIYTAGGDSEGTLGGLVRQGRHDLFPAVFRKAIESARMCSSDPVCSLSKGQGRDSLNLAACYSCALLPETSCEVFNAFLDRGVVVGTMERPEIGFFANQLQFGWQGAKIYTPERKKAKSSSVVKPGVTIQAVLGHEVNMSGLPWRDIWDSIGEYAADSAERRLFEDLKSRAELFEGKEQPLQDCAFKLSNQQDKLYQADLLWPNSRVALFMSENRDCYDAALQSDWHCFLIGESSWQTKQLADSLKGAL